MMKKIMLIASLNLLYISLIAQCGGIMSVEYNSDDPDSYKFVALSDIAGGIDIHFTDNGWKADNTFRTGEGTTTYSTGSGISIGTVITVNLTGPALSGNGDQIIAYTGSSASPTFWTAIQMNGGWDADATSSNTSANPNAPNSIAIDPEQDNAAYIGITTGSCEVIKAALEDPMNWSTSNSTRQTYNGGDFDISGAAPVVYASIKLENTDGANTLTWATASEVNNDYFDIEHSLDGENFTAMGRVGAKSNARAQSDYQFIHENPIQGMHYYRLKQVDLDGTYAYSEVKNIDVVIEGEVTIYPTMVRDRLTVRHNFIDPARVSIFNMSGQEMISYEKVDSETTLDASTLAPNVYIIHVTSGNQQVTRKIIKQ